MLAIAAGVAVPLALLIAGLALLFCLRRRRRRAADERNTVLPRATDTREKFEVVPSHHWAGSVGPPPRPLPTLPDAQYTPSEITGTSWQSTIAQQGQGPAPHETQARMAVDTTTPALAPQRASARAEKRAMLTAQNVSEAEQRGAPDSRLASTVGPTHAVRDLDDLPTSDLVRILANRLDSAGAPPQVDSPPVYEEVGRGR